MGGGLVGYGQTSHKRTIENGKSSLWRISIVIRCWLTGGQSTNRKDTRTHTYVEIKRCGTEDETRHRQRLQLAGIEQTRKQRLSGSAQSPPPVLPTDYLCQPFTISSACHVEGKGTAKKKTLPVWHITLLAHDQTTRLE